MRNIFLIFSIIIFFSSLKYNLSSSPVTRNRRNHYGSSKINTKPHPRMNSNNNIFHSNHISPRTIEEFTHTVSKPSFKNWFRMHRHHWHKRDNFHHSRPKRNDKYPYHFYKKHFRDIREASLDEELDETTNVNDEPTIIPTTEGKLEIAADALEQMQILLKDIDIKISSLSNDMKHDPYDLEKIHTIIPSEIRRRQSKGNQSPLVLQMLTTLKPNTPNEVSRHAKQVQVTPGDPLLEISQILSLLPQNKASSMDQSTNSTINIMQKYPLSNTALQKVNIDKDYVKNILNMSLQNMDQKQILDFVANALLNNTNFIETLTKNISWNQRATKDIPMKNNVENANFYTGEFVVLILLFIIAIVVIIVIAVWHFLGNPWISSSDKGPKTKGKTVLTTPTKDEKEKTRKKQGELSEETESSLEMPHISLKNMIRKSVVEDGHHAKKEPTRDLMKRAGTEDYISVEGFKKWNNNWKPSREESKIRPTNRELKSKPRIPSIANSIASQKTKQRKRISTVPERRESTTTGTLDDTESVVSVGVDPDLGLSKDKVFSNRSLNMGAVDLFR